MKHIYNLIFIMAFGVMGLLSCGKYDNYDGPNEQLTGKIIDKATGLGVQTQIGGDGIRIKLLEYSWSDHPTPYYFNCKQDGTFNNTRIFKGNYNIEPLGAFVPLLLKDAQGNLLKDETKTTDIIGTVDLTFEVEPFLRIEWVGEPMENPDGSYSVSIQVTRGTEHPDFQKNITDVYLFVSNNAYVGNNNFIANYSTRITYSGSEGNQLLGNTFTLTTKPLPTDRVMYLRVGARTDINIDGTQRYNYSTIKSVDLR